MPVTPTYPGVYIEEIPSGVRTITGVATSITAFVGYTRKGEPDKGVPITSFAEFERAYGGLDRDSPVSYAVNQFFRNGGTQAVIVRVAAGTQKAGWELQDGTPSPVLDVQASSPGTWGNYLRLSVEHADTRNPDGDFNLVVLQVPEQGGPAQKVEVHRNLNLNPKSSNYLESVVNNTSRLIHVTRKSGLAFSKKGCAVSKDLTFPLGTTADPVIAGVLDGTTPFRIDLGTSAPADLAALVTAISTALGTLGLGANLVASQSNDDGSAGNTCLKLESQTTGESSSVMISGGALGSLAAKLGMGLANGGREFPADAEHRPKVVSEVPPSSKGADGNKGSGADLIGSETNKTGIYALLDIDLFNILVIPETFEMQDNTANSVIQAGVDLCEKRRAFYIVDPPTAKDLSNIAAWANGASQTRNAAVYFPAIKLADPLDDFRPRAMAASGTIAGVYARTDTERGVWKAPAGTDAVLRGVEALTTFINDLENGRINQKGVNALRVFRDYGKLAWGARTMKGSDAQADEYKYVPVRRLALFLEESLYRSTQWVVFEPNDEPLWAQLRLNIGSFMHSLFLQGAFQGKTPREAYLVKCDRETTTQDDINKGIVNILVGFAPLRPAEFVIIKIQQLAGQIQT
jgi:phage tail sheath protein FI